MASKVFRKINSKLKFLYRQSRYQFPAFRRILSNSLIQPHFDLKKKLKNKYQKDQNKHIPFSLNLIPRSRIDPSHFRKIKWLPASRRVEYYIANTVFKHQNGIVPGYIHEIFKPSLLIYSTRSQMALDIPLRKTNTGQKRLSLLGPKIWSKINPSSKNVKRLLSDML